MQIFIIIISVYAVYFLGNIIYDGFISKPKLVKSDDSSEPVFVFEEDIFENEKKEELQVVNFDSTEQLENQNNVVLNEIEEKSDEEISLEFEKKNQEEKEIEDFTLEEKSFINSFSKYLQGTNVVETISPIEESQEILDVFSNVTNITSFSYAEAQLI